MGPEPEKGCPKGQPFSVAGGVSSHRKHDQRDCDDLEAIQDLAALSLFLD